MEAAKAGSRGIGNHPLTMDALWTGILEGFNPLFSLNTKPFVHPKSA